MRDRAAGKKRRDRERVQNIAKRGNGKPNRDKKARRLIRQADAERHLELVDKRKLPRERTRFGCLHFPEKIRYEHEATALRWAAILQLRHSVAQHAFPCPHCDGWHISKMDRRAA